MTVTSSIERPNGCSPARETGKPWQKDCLALLLLTVVGLLACLPWLGSYGLLDPTDSFFIESAREMNETGRYLLALNNYDWWLDKPVCFFLMVAASLKIFGFSTFAGRLPAALSAVATVLIMYWSTRGMVRRRTAVLSGLIFLSMPLSSVVAHVCLTDMTLTACIAATTLFLWRGLVKSSPKDLLFGYLACAFGIFCKGPISPILSLIAIVPTLFLFKRSLPAVWQSLSAMRLLPGLAGAFALNVPWYAWAGIETHGKFLEIFFVQQNFGRMTGTVNHQMPWHFYIPVFFGGFAPWCLLTITAPKALRGLLRKDKIDSTRGLLALCLVWFVAVVGMFTIIKTKLPTYILPAAPAFALLVAIQLDMLFVKAKARPLAFVSLACLIALIVAVCIQGKLPPYLHSLISDNVACVVGVLLATAASIFSFAVGRGRWGAVVLACGFILGCTVFVPNGLKGFYVHKQEGFNRLVCLTRGQFNGVAILSAEQPTMVFFLRHPVHRIQSAEAAQRFVTTNYQRYYIIVPQEMVVRLDWFPSCQATQIAKEGKWVLFELTRGN